MNFIFTIFVTSTLLVACGSTSAATSEQTPAPVSTSAVAPPSATPETASARPTPTGPSFNLNINTVIAKKMLRVITEVSDPLTRMARETEDFNDYGFEFADSQVMRDAAAEVRPVALKALKMGTVGDRELDADWTALMEQLIEAVDAVDLAFTPGNDYAESDYLIAGLKMGMYVGSQSDFMEALANELGITL